MDCGIECIKFLLDYYHINNDLLLNELYSNLNEYGLNLKIMINVCNAYNLKLKAYKSYKFIKQYPYIVLLRGKKTGHFIVILKVNIFSVEIYDPIYKYKKINKFILWLFFKFIIIICYNNLEVNYDN